MEPAQFTTKRLIEYLKARAEVEMNSPDKTITSVDCVNHVGGFRCTHHIGYESDTQMITGMGIDDEYQEITPDEFLNLYPEAIWTVEDELEIDVPGFKRSPQAVKQWYLDRLKDALSHLKKGYIPLEWICAADIIEDCSPSENPITEETAKAILCDKFNEIKEYLHDDSDYWDSYHYAIKHVVLGDLDELDEGRDEA